MRKILSILAVLSAAFQLNAGTIDSLPDSVFVGNQPFHVQGIALDREAGCFYLSFTSEFLKVDFKGNVIGSLTGIPGHLGAMTFDPVGRKVYASLEYKDDEIGTNITDKLKVDGIKKGESVFYIAEIDVDKINSVGMDQKGILRNIEMPEVCSDYAVHRFGCSGIDGVTIGPALGASRRAQRIARGRILSQPRYLYIAYGIYGDNNRSDNDYQIILCYRLGDFSRPVEKYFIFTGNTTYGVQNMAYDPYTGKVFMAVYKGKKPQYPNYSLYAFRVDQRPFKAELKGCPEAGIQHQLRLDSDGLSDPATGITGWNFKHGSTGFCPIGDGYFYISEKGRDPRTKTNSSNVRLYRWTGNADVPFEKVNR